ncbi:MAG: trimethylamine methyltransferase family protein, partial [Desulfobacterales bacterium]|nr:trimethylamine methyltransferase family protein [Desulfobacterales bacterium]
MSQIKACLSLLTPEHISDIHNMVLTILQQTGIRVDDSGARAVFEKALGTKAVDNRVLIPMEIVDWAISASPTSIAVCRRDSSPAFTLNSKDIDQSVFGIGVTNLYYQDPLSDDVTPFARSHMA